MRRREIIALLGVTAAWPVVGHTQQPVVRVIGYLSSATSAGFAHFVAAFRSGLGDAGFVEGRNLAIEYRWAEGQNDRLASLAADLVNRQVRVIVATGGTEPALAAKAATSIIPIVFTGGADPVKFGLVKSLAQPGGNATGVVNISTELTAKRLGLLRELVPTAAEIAVLVNPTTRNADEQLAEIQEAARITGQSIHILKAVSERDFKAVFATIVQQRVGALFVAGDPFFTSRRVQLVELAAHHAIPASYAFRDFAVAGGLISYGANLLEVHRQAGVYAGRILNGAKPAELPVLQPTNFELVINLKSAKALGLIIPPTLLTRADEVIE
jgi:putative tryptophan/tyrosine transport system substrate-binding protein